MPAGWDKFIGTGLAAFLAAFLLTPAVRELARRLGVMDLPDARRIHLHPTPRGGGLAIYAALHLAYLVAHWAGWTVYAYNLTPEWWRVFFAGSTCVVLVGLLDDAFGLRPWWKLGGQVLAASIMILGHGGMGRMLGFEFDALYGLNFALTLLWFLAIMNAFNLIDGMDGLAAGLAAIAALGMGGAMIFLRMPGDAVFLVALAAAALGFLRYNFHPASVFLGDTGSLFLGFTLAAMATATSAKGAFLASVGVPLLAMGVPVFDTVLAVWRRSLRRYFHSSLGMDAASAPGIMQADTEHLHHRFLGYGLPPKRVALLLYGFSSLLAVVGLLGLMLRRRAAGIYLLTFVAAAYVIVRHLSRVELWDTGRILVEGLRRPARKVAAYVFYVLWDLAWLILCFTLTTALCSGAAGVARADWLTGIPFWAAPVFLGLCLTGQYDRVWSHARFGDYLTFSVVLVGGVLVSLGLTGTWRASLSLHDLQFGLFFLGLLYPSTLGARMVFRGVLELMSRPRPNEKGERVLLYGAGSRCDLFVREWSWQHGFSQSSVPRTIIGIVDDDPNLRGRRSHGFRVLGSGEDLPQLLQTYSIAAVIVTAEFTREKMAAIKRQTDAAGVRMNVWFCGERAVDDLSQIGESESGIHAE